MNYICYRNNTKVTIIIAASATDTRSDKTNPIYGCADSGVVRIYTLAQNGGKISLV